MDQKEQTKCMGSDGMQKMNGVINADLMTVEEIIINYICLFDYLFISS